MASVNIVTSDRGWILERLASEITNRLDYVRHTEAPDPAADINYYVTYSCWSGRVSRIEVGWFAHLEPLGEAHDKFFAAAAAMDHVFTQARRYEDLLRARGIANVTTLSPGVDLDRFAPKLKVGVVGRAYHTGRKGEHLVGQLVDMPEIAWHFTGTGWPGPALELSDEDLPQFYRDMDYILVPSLYEGGPMCVVEALASGTEVIASPVGWVPDFPHIEFRTGDVDDLRRVLLDLYAAKRRLRDSVADRTWDAWAQGHHRLFQTLLARHPEPGLARGLQAKAARPIGRAALLMHGNEANSQGGPSVRVPRTARELVRSGVRAEALSFNDTDLDRFDLVHTFNVWAPQSALKALRQARRQKKVSVFSPIFLDLSERPFFDKALLDVFRSAARPEAVDDRIARLASRWDGVRRDPGTAEEPMGGYFAMIREMVELADHLILLSDKERHLLTAIGAAPRAWSIVRNPTDNAAFRAADPDLFGATTGIKDFVLCVGRVEARKNQLMLAHALRDTGIPLVLIGHVPSAEYRELIERYGGDNVHLLGRLPAGSDLLLSAFRAARVATLPSWCEGAPLAALEAAAAGASLVLSDRSSEPEYFGSYARYANPADPRSIRETILAAYETPRTPEMREAQVAFVAANYGWGTYTARTREAYEAAIDGARGRPAEAPIAPPPRSLATQRQRLLFDLTSSVNRNGRITGIPRVEMALALALAGRPDVDLRFVHWDNTNRRFVELPPAVLRDGSIETYRDPPEGSFAEEVVVAPGAQFIVSGSGWMQNAVYAEGVAAFAQVKQAELVVIIHDMIPVLFPYWFNDDYVPVFERNMRVILANADRLVAISQTTKQDVEAVLRRQIDLDINVITIREGDQIGDHETASADASTAVPPGLDRFAGTAFVIAVGAIHARKNHKVLYDVWVRLAEQLGARCPTLVIVGGVAWNGTDLARTIRSDARLRGRVVLLDKVDDAGLSWLYRNCLFTAYPSLYEGWGLPVCESLRYGKICLASDASSIREIAPDVTDLLDPLDFAAWLTRIRFYATSASARAAREAVIRNGYRPTPWAETAAELSRKLRASVTPNTAKARTHLGVAVSFAAGGNPRRHLRGPWHISEAGGAFTAAAMASVEFFLPTRPVGDLVLAMKVRALPPPGGRLEVGVSVDGRRLATWTLHNQVPQIRFVLIDRAAVDPDGLLRVTFTNASLFAVAETTGAVGDRRSVGIGLAAAVLTEVQRADRLRAILDPKGECEEAIGGGDRVSLLDGRRAARMQGGDWTRSSAWGLWPATPDAKLYVVLDGVPPRPVRLRLSARGVGTNTAPMRVGVFANDVPVGTWQFDEAGIVERDVVLPPSIQVLRQPVELRFVPERRASPRERGVGQEDRPVSIGLFEIAEAGEGAARRPPAASIPLIEPGEQVLFRAGATSRGDAPVTAFLQHGWYGPEKAGVWSRGTMAELAFRLPRVPDRGLTLFLTVRALGIERVGPMRMTIAVNGRLAVDEAIERDVPPAVPVDLRPGDVDEDGVVWLTLTSGRVLAPSALGPSADERLLGLQVVSLATESGLVVHPSRSYAVGARSDVKDAFLEGWHPFEQTGSWSQAGQARLRFAVEANGAAEATFTAEVRVYGSSVEGSVAVDVMSHGAVLATWTFANDEIQSRSVTVPLQHIGGKAVLDIGFLRHGATSPVKLGLGEDHRELGLWLGSFALSISDARLVPVDRWLDLLDPTAEPLLQGSWGKALGWGAWPADPSSRLVLSLDPALGTGPAFLDFTVRAAATPARPRIVDLVVNGVGAGAWRFEDAEIHRCRLGVPPAADPGRPLEIRLLSSEPARSPADLSIGAETRAFSIGLFEVRSVPGQDRPLAAARLPALGLGEMLEIGNAATARSGAPVRAFLASGWFAPDREGAWSRGRVAGLAFALDRLDGGPMVLSVTLRAMASPARPAGIALALNGTALLTRVFTSGDIQEIAANVPPDLLGAQGAMLIEIRTSQAIAPSSTGVIKDDRLLGFQLLRLKVSAGLRLDLGQLYGVTPERRLAPFCKEGWYSPEESGVWSRGEPARIVAELATGDTGPFVLEATLRVFGTRRTGPANVELLGPAGDTIDVWTFRSDEIETRAATVTARNVDGVPTLDIAFRRKGAISPASLGLGDHRVLGVWLLSLRLIPARAAGAVSRPSSLKPG